MLITNVYVVQSGSHSEFVGLIHCCSFITSVYVGNSSVTVELFCHRFGLNFNLKSMRKGIWILERKSWQSHKIDQFETPRLLLYGAT